MSTLIVFLIMAGAAIGAAMMAKKQRRSALGWAIGTFFFPPVIIILLLLNLKKMPYEPGGAHYVRISNEAFEEAKNVYANSSDTKKEYSEYAAKVDLTKYEASDFPVSEICGVFAMAHCIQEEKNGIPAELRLGAIELGRKDRLDLQQCVERWKDRLPGNEKGLVKGVMLGSMREAANESIGISIATGVAKGIFKGVARVATGKSEDTRIFEKLYANYLCGNSSKAKEYLLGFAKRFGGLDEGLLAVAETIMGEFWLVEIAKENRGFVSSGTQQ